jgi:hypothetical protein
MAQIMDKNFVIVKLDVMESADKKALENPGGDAYMKLWHGEKSGLPFLVVLDEGGTQLINSNKTTKDESSNIGYPAKEDEIAHFLKMLRVPRRPLDSKSVGRAVDEKDLKQIESWLKAHAPKS